MRGTPSPPLHLSGIDASIANTFSHCIFTNVPVLVPTLEAYVHYLPKVFANPRMAHQAQPADPITAKSLNAAEDAAITTAECG